MYILWSKQEYDNKYIIFIENTLEKLKQLYVAFCEKNKDDYNFDTFDNIKEKDLDSFSLYSRDCNFYYSNVEGVDANKQIYIFTFNEYEECGYYHRMYFEISPDKDELLERATEYFITESRKTKQKHIDEMISNVERLVDVCRDVFLIPFVDTNYSKADECEKEPDQHKGRSNGAGENN
jgi:hypothetical protein